MGIGKIIHEIRLSKNINLDDLCHGLCSSATLWRIENDFTSLSLLLFETLMQRMGKSPYKYEYLASYDEQEKYAIRKKILNLYQYTYEADQEQLIFNELDKLSKKLKPDDTINKQFIKKMKLIVSGSLAVTEEEAVSEWLEVLCITVPDFKIGMLNDYYLSLEELRIYFFIGIRYMDFCDIKASIGIFNEILEYLETWYTDYEERVKLYPQIAYQLALLYEKIDDYENMLSVCTKGVTLLKDYMYIFLLPELLLLQSVAMKELYNRNEEKFETSTYNEYEKIKKHAMCLDEIIKKYTDDEIVNVKKKQYQYKIINDEIRRFYPTNEIIRRNREIKGLTQDELSEGICVPEHMSRIETGLRNPNMRNYQLIMEKLGHNKERYQSSILADNFEILEMEQKLTMHIARYQYEDAEEIFLDMSSAISNDVPQNKQFLIMTKAKIDYGLKRITNEKKLEQCEQALKCTIFSYKKWKTDFVKVALSSNEIALINNIASLYKGLGELQYASNLLKEALESYKKLKTGVEYHVGNYTFLLTHYASILGLLGNYAEAIVKHREVIMLSIKYGYGDYLGDSLYGISWNLLKLGEINKEACKKLCRQAYIVCDIMKNDYIKEWMNNKYNEVFCENIKI